MRWRWVGSAKTSHRPPLRLEPSEDTPLRPLRDPAARLIAGKVDVVLLTRSMQMVKLMKIRNEEGIPAEVLEARRTISIGSIGPVTSQTLEDYKLKADFEPNHPTGPARQRGGGGGFEGLAGKR